MSSLIFLRHCTIVVLLNILNLLFLAPLPQGDIMLKF